MKNQTIVAPKATMGIRDAFKAWLSNENFLFTLLMERKVTNRQMLLLSHAMVPFSLLVGSLFYSSIAAMIMTAWFGLACLMCKKGGC